MTHTLSTIILYRNFCVEFLYLIGDKTVWTFQYRAFSYLKSIFHVSYISYFQNIWSHHKFSSQFPNLWICFGISFSQHWWLTFDFRMCCLPLPCHILFGLAVEWISDYVYFNLVFESFFSVLCLSLYL